MSKKLVKAHQGTIVNGQIVYPTTSQAPADPEPIMPKPRGRPEPFPSPFPNQPYKPVGKRDPSVINVKPYGQVPDFMQPQQAQQVAPTARPAEPAVTEAVPVNNIKLDPNNFAPNEMVVGEEIKTRTLQDFLNTMALPQEQRMQQQGQQMQQALNDPNLPEQFREDLQRRFDRFNLDMKQRQFLGNDTEKQRAFGEYQQFNRNEMGMRQGQDAIQNLFKDSGQQYDEEVAAIKEKYNTMGGNPAQNFIMRQRELMDARGKRYRRNKEIEQGDTFKNLRRNLEDLQFEDAKRMFDDFSSNYKAVGKGQSVGKPMQFNEGGTVMEKQMDFFMGGGMSQEKQLNFFDEGGMKDDGGEKDPVSGNDVPSGSMAKEVRDDVPAMVSEGEFIFPADVTRFIGLNKLMELRQDAKMGLKKMEAMGQLGNPDDAELPDDIPFDAADILIIDDEMEADEKEMEVDKKYAGGVFGYQSGTGDPRKPDLGGEPGPLTIIDPEMGGSTKPNQSSQSEPTRTYSPITQAANQQYANRYAYYQNDKGDKITILTNWRGEPLQAVPAGYKLMLNQDGSPVTEKPQSEKDKDDVEATQPAAAQGAKQDDNDPKDPMQIIEEGRKSAEVTAKRLGMEVDDYLKLPIKTRFNLIGEELKVMRGAEPDLEKIEGIVNGTIKSGSGDGIFGFSLLGGIVDTIGSMLDKDGNGSMWSSTVLNPDGTGKEVDIFGNTIRTFTEKEMEAFGELVDGKWQGNLENPYKPKGSKGGSGGTGGGSDKTKPTVSSTTTKFDATKGFKDGKPQTARGRKADSDRYSAMAKSYQNKTPGYEKNKSDKNEFAKQTGGKPIESDAITAKEMGTGAGSYNPVTRSIAQKQQKENKTAKDITRDVMGGDLNKGKLIARPPTKKKPTKGKTLVTKRS